MLRKTIASGIVGTATLATFATLLTGCGVWIHDEDDDDHDGIDSVYYTDINPSSPTPAPTPTPNPCSPDERKPDVIYSVTRNSRLETNRYEIGSRLQGRIYVSAYQLGRDGCEAPVGTRDLYEKDVRGIWIEVTQMAPYDSSFIKTYSVPEEAVSFHDASEDMGLIIDPSYIVLDGTFAAGHDYLVRIKLENGNGVVTSAKAWNNDMEAFHSIGFTVGAADDGAADGGTADGETADGGAMDGARDPN
jgi:hypothetical protein